MNAPSAVRAVVYARISADPGGEAAGVARQVKEASELAARNGWTVVAVIEDNYISALKGGHRPGYAEVLRLVRLGRADQVVVYQTSRLVRNRRERAEAIELFAARRVGIIAVSGVSFDLSTAYGRGQASLLGEFDTMESEVQAERIASAALDRAQRGRPAVGLGYGWVKHGTGPRATWTENPEQAAIVREIVDRLLDGEPLAGITADLNARGVPPPGGPRTARGRRSAVGHPAWGRTTAKKLALRESNIAVRLHHRGRDDEARYPGCWPPLVDADKDRRLRARLSDPRRRTNGHVTGDESAAPRPGRRRHLLSWGVGECGVCGGLLRVSTRRRTDHGKPTVVYACDARGCVGRNEAAVDALAARAVTSRMSRKDALGLLLSGDDEARWWTRRAEMLQTQLDEAAGALVAGDFTRGQADRISARLKPALAEAEEQERRVLAALGLGMVKALTGPQAAEAWARMTVVQKRAVVEALGLRVIIDPTPHRGRVPRDADGNLVPPGVRIEWER